MEKKVMCPCCGEELFRIGVVQTDPLVLGKNGPSIMSDEKGHFICCPLCSTRVVFVGSEGGPAGKTFQLSDIQPCEKCP